jgi:hypothetical protein
MNHTDPNAALLRHYYLQQLGIVAYVPRQHLGESVDATDEEATKEMAVASVEPQVEHVPPFAELVVPSSSPPVIATKCEPQLAGFLDAAERPVVEANSVQPRDAAKNVVRDSNSQLIADEASESVAFQLLFAITVREVAVVLQIPKQSASSLTPSEQKLLHNVLQWLGLSFPAAESYRAYQWPLPGLNITTAEAAKRGLQMFLAQAASESSFQHLLVLGALLVDGQSDVASGSASWRCWCAPSLAEMLALPSLKRDAWQCLLPLQQQLVRH